MFYSFYIKKILLYNTAKKLCSSLVFLSGLSVKMFHKSRYIDLKKNDTR